MDIIKSSSDITNIFTQGRRIQTPYLTFIVLEQRDCTTKGGGRVAFVAGKRNGNAVWRNASKRRMREICRIIEGPWDGYDVVFVAKQRILKEPFSVVKDAAKQAIIQQLLKK